MTRNRVLVIPLLSRTRTLRKPCEISPHRITGARIILLEHKSGMLKALTTLPVLRAQFRVAYQDNVAAVLVRQEERRPCDDARSPPSAERGQMYVHAL